MFNLPEGKKISPEEVKTPYEIGTVEDCEEIDKMYRIVAQKIEEGDDFNIHDAWMKTTLQAHQNMIENRKDWDMCQKTVRRRRIISMWHNSQILKQESEDKSE